MITFNCKLFSVYTLAVYLQTKLKPDLIKVVAFPWRRAQISLVGVATLDLSSPRWEFVVNATLN